jgi:hypothetical protein
LEKVREYYPYYYKVLYNVYYYTGVGKIEEYPFSKAHDNSLMYKDRLQLQMNEESFTFHEGYFDDL